MAVCNKNSVSVDSYENFWPALSQLAKQENASLWLDPNSANLVVWNTAKEANIVSSEFPIALWKVGLGNNVLFVCLFLFLHLQAIKNEAEQNGMRQCHVQDAVALTRFLCWLSKHGVGVSEVDAAQRLLEFREEEEGFVGISFRSILGTGGNGAIIHYSPSPDRPFVIGSDDMVLIDSGGHYKNGTTDVTRTVHMGTPTEHQVFKIVVYLVVLIIQNANKKETMLHSSTSRSCRFSSCYCVPKNSAFPSMLLFL